MRIYLLLILFIFQISSATEAKRFVIPHDSEVLENYTYSESVALYPHDFEVLVWNIYKSAKKSFYQEWTKLGYQKDIILVQEALESDRFLESIPAIGVSQASMARAWLNGRGGVSTGVMTLSKSSSVMTTWLRSPGREPIIRTPKMSLVTTYNLAGMKEKLMVVNIHALNFTTLGSFKRTLSEVKPKVESHKGPILFAGDFNTHVNSRYTFMHFFFRELGFSQIQFNPDNRFKILGRYLDWAFVKGLRVHAAEAPESSGSDHSPMVMRLSLF